MEITVWEVEIKLTGPIKIKNNITFRTEKGFTLLPFYSDINLKNMSNGIRATVTAYANEKELAYSAAFVFFGQMVDVLSYKINQPLMVNHFEEYFTKNQIHEINRLVSKEEFSNAFEEARELLSNNRSLLKAYGWYRKGLTTSDPYDQLLAFWNVIEIIAPKYHHVTNRSRKGIVNKTWQCFIDIWGSQDNWPIIGHKENWINNVCEIRNQIVHGGREINLDNIMEIMSYVEEIKKLSSVLLQEINNLHREWGGYEINEFTNNRVPV